MCRCDAVRVLVGRVSLRRADMLRRQLPPGEAAQMIGPDLGQQTHASVQPLRGPSDNYLFPPREDRLGICCSGGGIRSAAFSLGGLQVLREKDQLQDAEYLSCVSGGAYTAIAHAVMTSETLKRKPQDMSMEDAETTFFGVQAPWAAGSPEERHLRDRLTYLAPGPLGKAWAFLNLLYGAIRILLPFVAGLY